MLLDLFSSEMSGLNISSKILVLPKPDNPKILIVWLRLSIPSRTEFATSFVFSFLIFCLFPYLFLVKLIKTREEEFNTNLSE